MRFKKYLRSGTRHNNTESENNTIIIKGTYTYLEFYIYVNNVFNLCINIDQCNYKHNLKVIVGRGETYDGNFKRVNVEFQKEKKTRPFYIILCMYVCTRFSSRPKRMNIYEE